MKSLTLPGPAVLILAVPALLGADSDGIFPALGDISYPAALVVLAWVLRGSRLVIEPKGGKDAS